MNIYKKAVNTFGIDAQINLLVEELSELIFAIQKSKRNGNICGNPITEQEKIDRYNNICEEISDVQLMLNQMKYIYDKKKINKYYKEKKKRLKRRLK